MQKWKGLLKYKVLRAMSGASWVPDTFFFFLFCEGVKMGTGKNKWERLYINSPTYIFFSDKPSYCVCNTSCCFRHLCLHTHVVLPTWEVSLLGDKSSILLDSPQSLFLLSILPLPPPGPDPWPIPIHVKDKWQQIQQNWISKLNKYLLDLLAVFSFMLIALLVSSSFIPLHFAVGC